MQHEIHPRYTWIAQFIECEFRQIYKSWYGLESWWVECVKRVSRLAISCLFVWCQQLLSEKNLKSIVLVWKLSWFCIPNETNQSNKIRPKMTDNFCLKQTPSPPCHDGMITSVLPVPYLSVHDMIRFWPIGGRHEFNVWRDKLHQVIITRDGS